MITKPPPFKGLKMGMLIISPVMGRGLVNWGSGLLQLACLPPKTVLHF